MFFNKNSKLDIIAKVYSDEYAMQSGIPGYMSVYNSFYQCLNLKSKELLEVPKHKFPRIDKRNRIVGRLMWLREYGESMSKYNFKEGCIYHLKVENFGKDTYKIIDMVEKVVPNEEVLINDYFFGECKFIKEPYYNNLKFVEGMNVFFGNQIIFKYDFIVPESKINEVMDSLKNIYKNANEILEKSYLKILKNLLKYPEFEEHRNIDLEYIKRNYVIDKIYVDEDSVVFFGNIEDEFKDGLFKVEYEDEDEVIDVKGSYIYVDFQTGNIECEIEEKLAI